MSKVKDTKENAEICINSCSSCMSYPGVNGEALFCSRGKSSADTTKQGCNCVLCEIQIKNECTGTYYCIEGPCE